MPETTPSWFCRFLDAFVDNGNKAFLFPPPGGSEFVKFREISNHIPKTLKTQLPIVPSRPASHNVLILSTHQQHLVPMRVFLPKYLHESM